MLREGIYKAEHNESMTDKYLIKIRLKETDKSYIFELLEFESRYPPAQMEMFFKNSKRVVLRKDKGGHAVRVWGEDSFTIYPYQAGIPFVFDLIDPPKEVPDPVIKGFTLSEKEYNLLDKIATKSKMDCWFLIKQTKSGEDYVYDLEEGRKMSLKKGIAQLIDGISGSYADYLSGEDYEILLDLLVHVMLK